MSKTRKTLAWLLAPLTMWYGIGVWVRGKLFDIGVLKSRSMPVTMIGVGNLAVGGTGKTPMVEYLLRLFSDNYRTALLSRGYRRTTHGYVEDDGQADATTLGDESFMMARKFPEVRVAVCEDRVAGVKRLMENGDVDLVVLDDVLQHRFIKPTINILLTEYGRLYCNDFVMPFGNLREGRRGSRRAEIIVVTKSPEKPHPVEVHNIRRKLRIQSYQKLLFSYIEYGTPVSLWDNSTADLSSVTHLLLVTGIAHPDPLLRFLRKRAKVVPLLFDDHHHYDDSDAARIRDSYAKLKGSRCMVVCTEKDAAKLRNEHWQSLLGDLPFFALPMKMAFCGTDGDTFDKTLRARVAENVHFRRLHRDRS